MATTLWKKEDAFTLALYKHLKHHNRMQTQSATISTGHAATNFFVENAELSLQLLMPSHMPPFLQQSRTTDQNEDRQHNQ